MFICTNKGSVLLKGIPSAPFNIVNSNRLIDSIKLAPSVEGESVDAIVVTSEDLSSKIIDDAFVEALKEKHPQNVVIYIHKKSKLKDESRYAAANYVLVKPNMDILRNTISEIISKSNKQAVSSLGQQGQEEAEVPAFVAGVVGKGEGEQFTPSTDTLDIPMPEQTPGAGSDEASNASGTASSIGFTADGREVFSDGFGGYYDSNGNVVDEFGNVISQAMPNEEPLPVIENPIMDNPYQTPVDTSGLEDMYNIPKLEAPDAASVNRTYTQMFSTAELVRLANDINLEKIIADITEKNVSYEQLEERISTLSANISRIMRDSDETVPLEERLRRVNALKYEKSRLLAAKATVLEQNVDLIISNVVNTVLEAYPKRVKEIEDIIIRSRPNASIIGEADIIRLKENRTNALVELDCFLEEITLIEASLRKLTNDTVSAIIDMEDEGATRDIVVDNQIARTSAPLIPQEAVDAIKHIYELRQTIPDKMQALSNLIHTVKNLIHHVLDVDSKLIEALEEATARLSLDTIASAQIKDAIAGRNIRVFIGGPKSGRSIIPYLFAKEVARENGNVLYVNLCGENKLKRYGVESTSLGEFLLNPIRTDISVVSGEITAATPIDEIAAALRKASPFYRAVYLVIPDDNAEAIEVFTDVCLAYFVVCDLSQGNHVTTAGIVSRLAGKTCVKNVIYNRYDSVTVKGVELLGIDTIRNIICFPFKNQNLLVSASINEEDPSTFHLIHTYMQTLRKYA